MSKYVRCEDAEELGRVLKFLHSSGANSAWDYSFYVTAVLAEDGESPVYSPSAEVNHFMVRIPRRYLKRKGYELLAEEIKAGGK